MVEKSLTKEEFEELLDEDNSEFCDQVEDEVYFPNKKKTALLTQYIGSNYAGWQRQKRLPSIQGELERALSTLAKEEIKLVGCSRTDAGVHALQHVSHFVSNISVPLEKLHIAANTLLPDDIVVLAAADVAPEFNARFNTRGKKYSYYIWNNNHKSAFLNQFTIQESRDLDLEAMREAARAFVGVHDFCGFMSQGSSAKTTVRELTEVSVHGEKGGLIRIDVAGTAFLYNMVRIIAGTLLYIGLGKIDHREIDDIILSGRRELAGKTLPAKALFLVEVYYEESPFKQWYNMEHPLAKFENFL